MKRVYLSWVALLGLLVLYGGCKDDGDLNCGISCDNLGVVVYLGDEGCVIDEDSAKLGILDKDGNLYAVVYDDTGLFETLELNDELKFGFQKTEPCEFDVSGKGAIQITCIRLLCATVWTNPCEKSEALPYKQYQDLTRPSYRISNLKMEGTAVKFNVIYSGCDATVNMELVITELPTMGPISNFVCKLDYEETSCKMLVTREICFNLGDLSGRGHLFIETEDGAVKITDGNSSSTVQTVDAEIEWTGSRDLDGCGYMIHVSDSTYKPSDEERIDANFKKTFDTTPIRLTYEKLNCTTPGCFGGNPVRYTTLKVYGIEAL